MPKPLISPSPIIVSMHQEKQLDRASIPNTIHIPSHVIMATPPKCFTYAVVTLLPLLTLSCNSSNRPKLTKGKIYQLNTISADSIGQQIRVLESSQGPWVKVEMLTPSAAKASFTWRLWFSQLDPAEEAASSHKIAEKIAELKSSLIIQWINLDAAEAVYELPTEDIGVWKML